MTDKTSYLYKNKSDYFTVYWSFAVFGEADASLDKYFDILPEVEFKVLGFPSQE